MRAIRLRLDERVVAARVDTDGRVTVDAAAFVVTTAGPGLYVVDDGEKRWEVAVADAGETRWVSVAGEVAIVEVERAVGSGRRKTAAGADAMMAPMPAAVVKVLVESGQTVTEGETVLVLEAMKMELLIRAPRAGVVAAVRCVAGELVQPGVVLVDLQ